MTAKKAAILGLWVLAGAALIAFASFKIFQPMLNRTLADDLGRGDYHLVTTSGTPFTQDTLKGEPSAVFFGFTHCPEVCPTTLGDIATWQEDLASTGQQIRVFFITVDPERDQIDQLRDYTSWVPDVQGVSGDPAEVEKAIQAFRIYARKVALDGGDYTMDHSASVLLFDAKGRFFEPIGYQEDYDRAVGKIRRLLNG